MYGSPKNNEQLLSRFRASHFSLLVQRKVTKRKHTLRRAHATRGSVGATGISGRGILPLPETAHVPVRRPTGLPIAPTAPYGPGKVQSKSKNQNAEFRRLAQIPAFVFDSLGHKASRAPQVDAAVEAPLFERSEFGRRAASAEEHRAPMRLHRIGSRPAQRFWLLLPRQK